MTVRIDNFTVVNLGGEYLLTVNYTVINGAQTESRSATRRLSAGTTKTQLDGFFTNRLLSWINSIEGIVV